jgi:hypothetical protein
MRSLKHFLLIFSIISKLKLTFCIDGNLEEPFGEYDRKIAKTNSTDLSMYLEKGNSNTIRYSYS